MRQVQLQTLVQVRIRRGARGVDLLGEVRRQQQDALLGVTGIVLGFKEKQRIGEHKVALPLGLQRTLQLQLLSDARRLNGLRAPRDGHLGRHSPTGEQQEYAN